MTVNSVRNPDRTPLEVPADNSRDGSGTLLAIMGRKSGYSLWGLVSNGVKRPKSAAGFTLIEIMLATVVLLVAVLGASAFRYHAALGARKADLQAAAARTALLLCESWRGGVGAPNTFDPTQLATGDPNSAFSALTIENTAMGPAWPTDFTLLGIYRITIGEVNCYATLSWKDIYPQLRALNVVVAWDRRGSSDLFEDADTFKLTTYVAN